LGKLAKYLDALSELKSQPFDGTSLLVVGGHLVKLLAAWPNVTTWIEKDAVGSDLHPAWSMTHWDMKEWASLAHVDLEIVLNAWLGLVKANLIYPDGTFPPKVFTYLIQRADDVLDISTSDNPDIDKSPEGTRH